jgi:hypothetical protein
MKRKGGFCEKIMRIFFIAARRMSVSAAVALPM